MLLDLHAAGTGRIRARSRRVLSRRLCFSAQRADLLCRFRSVWAWVAVMRLAVAFAIGDWLLRLELVNQFFVTDPLVTGQWLSFLIG